MKKLNWGMIGGGEGSQIGPAHRPERDDLCRFAEELFVEIIGNSVATWTGFKQQTQYFNFQRAGTHALTVYRIERADRISDHEQACRETGHLIVSTPFVSWKLEC